MPKIQGYMLVPPVVENLTVTNNDGFEFSFDITQALPEDSFSIHASYEDDNGQSAWRNWQGPAGSVYPISPEWKNVVRNGRRVTVTTHSHHLKSHHRVTLTVLTKYGATAVFRSPHIFIE